MFLKTAHNVCRVRIHCNTYLGGMARLDALHGHRVRLGNLAEALEPAGVNLGDEQPVVVRGPLARDEHRLAVDACDLAVQQVADGLEVSLRLAGLLVRESLSRSLSTLRFTSIVMWIGLISFSVLTCMHPAYAMANATAAAVASLFIFCLLSFRSPQREGRC